MVYHTHESSNYASANGFEDLAATVADAVNALRPHRDSFDAIVATGVSGIVVAAPLSVALNRPLVVVRKPGDDSHSYRKVEGAATARDKRLLWVDDFSCSGDTLRNVERALADTTTYVYDKQTGVGEYKPINARIVAHFLYQHNDYIEVTA